MTTTTEMVEIASDHAAVDVKGQVIGLLGRMGRACRDLGPGVSEAVDYADYAHRLAERISSGAVAQGVLICGTGIGMSMAANRHPGVRAALCHDAFTAEMARRHNDANLLCLGARVVGPGVAEQIVEIFFTTPFDGGRHQPRIAKIERAIPILNDSQGAES